ncbi:MAG: hypothetical protein CFH37_00708, partial [Alphaproteobacteria bacterium MarineAlpha9_Bin7]
GRGGALAVRGARPCELRRHRGFLSRHLQSRRRPGRRTIWCAAPGEQPLRLHLAGVAAGSAHRQPGAAARGILRRAAPGPAVVSARTMELVHTNKAATNNTLLASALFAQPNRGLLLEWPEIHKMERIIRAILWNVISLLF